MTWYTCAAATALLLVGLSSAVLPFLSVWDHRLAIARRRSVYDKSAGQVETLTAVAQIVFAVALAGDMLAGGLIDGLMKGPWRFLWELTTMTAAFAALCAVLVLFMGKSFRSVISVVSGLASMFAACLACVLSWAFFMGALSVTETEAAEQSFLVIAAGLQSVGFVLFMLFAVGLAATAAYGVALCWHILCRNRDDFGRDYYTFVLTMRGRQAAGAGLLLTVFAALLYFMAPGHNAGQDGAVLPLTAPVWAGGLFCIPAASVVWFMLSRCAVPMQKRTLAFLGMALLAVGAFSVFCIV